MSRRKNSRHIEASPDVLHNESAPTEQDASGRSPAESTLSESRPNTTRLLLMIIVGMAVIWWVSLSGLALLTANPVTLNRDQIQRSDYVVTIELSQPNQKTLDVLREWKSEADFATISIRNLKAADLKSGRRYLIPLTKEGGDVFRITDTRLAREQPLAYPETTEAIEQLLRILGKSDEAPRE